MNTKQQHRMNKICSYFQCKSLFPNIVKTEVKVIEDDPKFWTTFEIDQVEKFDYRKFIFVTIKPSGAILSANQTISAPYIGGENPKIEKITKLVKMI